MGAWHIECHCVSSIECWSGVSSVGVEYRVLEWSIECWSEVSSVGVEYRVSGIGIGVERKSLLGFRGLW
jgi:hypothetical protein